MGVSSVIEQNLRGALSHSRAPSGPPILADAMQYAVFPGGSRTRPRLCLAVADACGGSEDGSAIAVATSLELLHCASLVHDDLPCFDDADLRRGKPSVHAAYGESIAILVGDALIVLAFDSLVRSLEKVPEKIVPLTLVVTEAVGSPHGIIAGQAWESEPEVDLAQYHRSKTGSLFVSACAAGALAAGANPKQWREVGKKFGQAYQALDDALDVVGSVAELGKPVQQDIRNGRPNLLASTSIEAVGRSVRRHVDEALSAVPQEASTHELSKLLRKATGQFALAADGVQAA